MEEDDAVQELERQYLKHFHDHVSETSHHLLGRVKGQPLAPSHILPTGHWTPAEKNIFFHALCIHSRLRPDLIAADVKTKTLVDICVYLDALEAGAAEYRNEMREEDEKEGGESEDEDEDEDGDEDAVGALRRELPFAMEVTDNWIEFEEGQAGLVAEEEERWDELALKKRNREALDDLRVGMERRSGEADSDSLLVEEELRQKRERAFGKLKKVDLIAMDRILREEEENSAKSVDDSNSTSKLAVSRPAKALKLAVKLRVTDEPMIDPVLGALSASQSMHRTQPATPPLTRSPSSPSPDTGPSTPAPEVEPSALLSPTSRRRYQKRLYMRRKRAEKQGIEVSKTVARLKPGRKSAKPPPKKRRKRNDDTQVGDEDEVEEVDLGQESSSEQDDEVDAESREPSPAPAKKKKKINAPGLTAPYKSLSRFAKIGVDASAIREQGLGLFYLARLERFMQMYYGLHDVPEKTNTAISSSLLSFLNLLIVEFVTDAVQKAVVSHEQEQRLKSRTKVWRTSDACLIDTASLGHALELMGVSCFEKRDVFKDLTSRLDLNDAEGDVVPLAAGHAEEKIAEPALKTKATVRTDGNDNPPGFPTGPGPPLLLSLHREIYQPVIRLPKYLSEEAGEELVSLDEDAWTGELEDENELDELDQEEEGNYEELLWRGCY